MTITCRNRDSVAPPPRSTKRCGDGGAVLRLIDVNVVTRRTGLPITPAEAVRGAKIDVPTTSGAVAMAVPKGANSGTRLRLKGKGVATGKAGAHGDQYVTLKIVLPDKPDDEFAEFLERWETENPYNPRTGLAG